MVDLHKIKPRLQSPILAQVLTQYPVVVVHGARQTVKTTLVQGSPIGQGRTFLSLDDYGREVASGVYIYRLNVGEWAVHRRMLLVR